MHHPKSSASGSAGAASNRGASDAAKRPTKSAPAAALSYLTVYRASPLERIDMIRRGIPASEAKRLFAELPIGQGAGFKALNLSTATVNKKAKQGATLSSEESERIVGFAKLVGQLEATIQDSGDPTNFDARAWMARWLAEPLPAFGGVRPADLMDTMEGQGLVSAALAKIQKRRLRLNVTVWRIATDTKTYEADDLSGAGAKHTGGRWNTEGDALVYTSETQALACLETVVHLNAGGLPLNRYLVSVTIPASVWAKARTETPGSLPVGWDADPSGRVSIQFGSAWIRSASSVLLRVPSVIVPDEYNLLINPRHPDSGAIIASKIRKFLYDPRLTKSA